MATGIIIHITVGGEKRTEFFSEERIRIGSDETCDLQIETTVGGCTKRVARTGEHRRCVPRYQLRTFPRFSDQRKADPPFIAVSDGDVIHSDTSDMSFSFFALAGRGSLIKTNREPRHVAQFIEEAALDAAASPQRDEAKAFLREFVRELSREISWTTKLITLVLAIGFITGVLYLGYAVNDELRRSRETSCNSRPS